MILLLSPLDNIIDFNKDFSTITKSDLVKALTELYEELIIIQREIPQEITEIKFINTVGHTYMIDDRVISDFIKRNLKKSRLLSPILKKASVVNLLNIKDGMDCIASISDEQKKYIFFDTLLSNDVVMYLSSTKNIVGYRFIKNNELEPWQKIENVERYLTICSVLYFQLLGNKVFFEFLDDSKEVLGKWYVDKMINKIEEDKALKHICLFNEWDNEDFDKFISALSNRFGFFESYRCKEGNIYTLPRNGERLLIFNFDVLDPKGQKSLLKELFSGEYNERLVIIFTRTVFDIRPYTQFESWISIGSILGISKDIINEVIQWSRIMDTKLDEYKSVIEKISASEKEKTKLNKKLIELSSGKLQFDAYTVDFWYDLESLELYNADKLKEFATQINKKYFPEEEKVKYAIHQEGNYWNIIVNDVEPTDKEAKKKKQINFTKSKAIRYLVYIIKYFGVNNPISFEDLSRSVSKWMDGKEKVVKYHTFSESIKDLYRNYSFLKPIDKYLHYNTKECYYYENNEIEFDLTNIDIPHQQLDSTK